MKIRMNKSDYWLTKERLFNKSILFYLNFFLVQWLFMRIGVVIEGSDVIGFRLIKPVLPISGWFGTKFIYIFGE